MMPMLPFSMTVMRHYWPPMTISRQSPRNMQSLHVCCTASGHLQEDGEHQIDAYLLSSDTRWPVCLDSSEMPGEQRLLQV